MKTSRLAVLLVVAVVACGASHAQQPVGEVFASDATVQGSVQLSSSGAKVLSGASVTSGDVPARLKLDRGGEVRVCARTSVAVSASASGRELMFAIGTGAIETDYPLASSADTILTPDFRILLAGPGSFHFALRSNANGDTCIQARPANGAALVVSDVMGEGTYQVKPNESVLFRKGRISDAVPNPPEDCGCPPPVETLRAQDARPVESPTLMASVPAPAAPPAPQPGAVQVEVDTPFVFRAEEFPPRAAEARRPTLASLPALPAAEPAPPAEPSALPLATRAQPPPELATEAKPQLKKKGAFSRLKSFFAAMFK
jgi:hypothetical protein